MRLQVILLLALCFAVPAGGFAQDSGLVHAIFLRVNSRTITQDEVVEAVRYLIKREYNGVMPEDDEELDKIQRAALRDLVRTILIHEEAGRLNIKVDPRQSKYAQSSSGLRPEEISPTIRRMLEADDLFDDIMMSSGTPVPTPSPREVKDFYNKNREEFRTNAYIIVRTIFLYAERERQAAYKAEAENMMRQLENVPAAQRTEAFAQMAREKSQDIFAEFGGLLTGDSPERWIPKDFENSNPDGSPIFPPTMVEEIRRLNRKGEIRLAVSADGMHLLYCEDVQGGKVLGWDEAARIIDYVLKQRVRNQRLRDWLGRVYDRSDVRWHDGTAYEKENLTEILLPSERVGGSGL
ncbi:MAG: peptidyl-prolyl cis-trans isomerase [Planctomycetes bacterium]|nr:peptidyl-prolyl cis-trans isomerase [Planctomycetota bacterium]